MNRLFISTQESYVPQRDISRACFEYQDQPLQYVYLFNHTSPQQVDENGDAIDESDEGMITCSCEEEARWFCEMIFLTRDIRDKLIIDYTTKSIRTAKALPEIIDQEKKEVVETKEVDSKTSITSIQQLELEEK